MLPANFCPSEAAVTVVRETPSTGRQRCDHEGKANAVKGDTLRSRVNALLTRRRSSLKVFSFVLTVSKTSGFVH